MATFYDNQSFVLTVTQGDCENFSFVYANDDETPIDLTGYTVEMSVKWTQDRNVKGQTINKAGSFLLSEGSGITVTPLEGRVDIELTAAQTAIIPYTGPSYQISPVNYQVRLTLPDGCKETFIAGTFIVFGNKF